MAKELHVFVIHSSFLAVRKNLIETCMERLKKERPDFPVKVTYILDHDANTLDIEKLRSMIDLTKPSANGGPSDVYDMLVKNIHVKQLSNALKHHEALQKAAALDEGCIALILEDDAVYGEDVEKKLFGVVDYCQEMKEDWDIVFLGLPQPVDQAFEGKLRKVNEVFRILPCIESYLVHPKGAAKLAEKYLPVKFATNIHLSYIASRNEDIKMMMTVNNVFVDGSKLGVYISTLEANNKLFLNNEFNRLNAIVQKQDVTETDYKEAQEIIVSMRFKQHPDNLGLMAILEMKCKHYDKAKELFEKAHELYTNNESILNNESEFLLQYTRLFKHIQEMP